jgi:hypothetical protein
MGIRNRRPGRFTTANPLTIVVQATGLVPGPFSTGTGFKSQTVHAVVSRYSNYATAVPPRPAKPYETVYNFPEQGTKNGQGHLGFQHQR